jgi:hypothetical protein
VLVGAVYWKPLLDLLRSMVGAGTIAPSDLDLLLVTDDLNEAVRHITINAVQRFGLGRRAPLASRVLGEASGRALTDAPRSAAVGALKRVA